jgi:hypothetical protein
VRRPFLAYDAPGFIDIEGNVAPEDCFLSRQAITHPADNPERFFDDFIERTRRSPSFSTALYAASLRHKVRPGCRARDLRVHGDMTLRGRRYAAFGGTGAS